MRLREHPKIQCRRGGRSEVKARLEDKILKEVDFIEPSKLLLSNEMDRKIYFAELYCFNTAFACRLHEKLMPMLGRPIREVGELDLQDSINKRTLKKEDIMRHATHGDTVKVHYRGKLHDGSVFDDTGDREPIQFTIGGGQVIPGLEEAVVGMKPGDSKTTELPVETAFGPYLEERVVEVPKNKFARWDTEPTVGERVPIPQPDGPPIDVTVTEVTESKVTVDFNHPLAGEELTIDIELIDIVYGAH